MATNTTNIGLVNSDDDETGWSGAIRANNNLIDSLYTVDSGDPNGVVTGKQNQLYRDSDTDNIWVCLVNNTNNNWTELGQLTKNAILNNRNIWGNNQALSWTELTATAVGAPDWTPTVEMSWVYINLDTSLTINLPSGLTSNEAAVIIIEVERTNPAIGITLSWDIGYAWALEFAPQTPANGDSIKVILNHTPFNGGTWRGEFSLLKVS